MAGTSLLALLDDIAALLDDVGAMTKVATKRTAGMLGDELALYSKEVSGVRSHRELPVVWAIARGSLLNKAILLPIALAVSALAPWAILPLMIVAGTYLCYEGFEKVAEKLAGWLGREHGAHAVATESRRSPEEAEQAERVRVRGAIRTDLVLSIEIFVITLNVVEGAPLARQALTLALVAALATIFVYGRTMPEHGCTSARERVRASWAPRCSGSRRACCERSACSGRWRCSSSVARSSRTRSPTSSSALRPGSRARAV